jgi:hypothetical protein
MDLEDIELVRSALLFRGAQGTTGTQASFMEIFHGDGGKIDELNEKLCQVGNRARSLKTMRVPSHLSSRFANIMRRKLASQVSTRFRLRLIAARSICVSQTHFRPLVPRLNALQATFVTWPT